MQPTFIYDTTLRDGTQGENINFSALEKLSIAERLDDFGVHYVEGGWPGSNPRDKQFFEIARRVTFKNAKIAAFGATRKPGTPADQDPNRRRCWKATARPSRFSAKAGTCTSPGSWTTPWRKTWP